MYKLTLTHEERQAIDWIGNRYRHGDELSTTLWNEYIIKYSLSHEVKEEDLEWDGDYDITFNMPEYIGWQVADIIQEDDCTLSCFGENFSSKLISFYENIV